MEMNIVEKIFRVNGLAVLHISTTLQRERFIITFLFTKRKNTVY